MLVNSSLPSRVRITHTHTHILYTYFVRARVCVCVHEYIAYTLHIFIHLYIIYHTPVSCTYDMTCECGTYMYLCVYVYVSTIECTVNHWLQLTSQYHRSIIGHSTGSDSFYYGGRTYVFESYPRTHARTHLCTCILFSVLLQVNNIRW